MTSTRPTAAVRRTIALTGLAAVAASLLVGTASAGDGARPAARDDDGLSAVRNATARFQDVQVALDSGYIQVSGCETDPELGGMGIHFLNPALAEDDKVVPAQPEILLYEPTPDGLSLVGVEYFVPEAATDGRRPSVLGRELEGPMPGHGGPMPSHYDLHLWAWKANPAGAQAAWNPDVSC